VSGPEDPVASAAAGGEPSEAELRAAYEAELARVDAVEVMLQAAVSLLNVAALRLRPPQGDGQPPPDLSQARDAIDGAGALLAVLEQRVPQDARPLRDALSQLQMAYARDAQAASRAGEPAGGGGSGGAGEGGGDPTGSGGEGGGDRTGSGGGGGAGGPGEGTGGGDSGEGPAGGGAEGESPSRRRPGPAESSGRLWVPGT
jgi:hypothetical protein